ncbi:MAG: type II toxin-antitoxin system VapC family toxin [Bryobacteraceae bacterium]|nr:type II toxin-antitoxin system VapC family toxin [Bryobacteraceae bacterium]
MVIDSSIILAIMLEEPPAREYGRRILAAPVRVMSA